MSSVSLELWQLITLGIGYFGSVFGFGKMLLSQVEARLDERFAHMEQNRLQLTSHWETRFTALETQSRETERKFMQLLAELPIQYELRENAVQRQGVLVSRLDGLADKLDRTIASTLRGNNNAT